METLKRALHAVGRWMGAVLLIVTLIVLVGGQLLLPTIAASSRSSLEGGCSWSRLECSSRAHFVISFLLGSLWTGAAMLAAVFG
jgi:hypothetical protein